jgi:serine/threonine-protein kinase
MSLENSSVDPVPGAVAGSDDASDVEVARVLEAYLAAVEAGQPADPRRLLDQYPHLASQLRACLCVLQVAEQAAQDVTAAPGVPPRSATGLSALSTLDFGRGEPPHVLLRELPDEPEPLIRPRSAAMALTGTSVGRFQLQGEIARGGMGAILKGRDVDLGRDLAIKVLLEAHQGNSDVLHRFVEEAQIGGQLQHPGVVPVYELGTFPDRRPYFAMKLVKGRTLAALLAERADPAQDLRRFLAIFEPVCQTMAYAHARGVIHRDLKPSNIMVGSFGEVQVMDWGLAKVLPEGGVADEARVEVAHETVITTVRSGSSGSASESQAGSLLGTPAYMAPEQARGEVKRIDERADVFGLGAILCEILTGKPPFVAASREEIRAQAARGDLVDARARLDACGADADLIELARSCLRPERDRRPRNAGEVARRMSTYEVGVQERLQAAELARVEAQTKTAEERKRRQLTVALATSVLVIVGLAGGGWTYLAQQRTVRLMTTTRVVTEALAEAERFRGQAQSALVGDLTKWSEAMGAAKRARDLLAEGETDDALQTRVATALADLEREQAAAQNRAAEVERDRKLLGELETIRGSRGEHWDHTRTDAEYAAAFRNFGIDLDQLDPQEAGQQIAQRSAPVELTSYIDEWALQRRAALDNKDAASWRRLLAVAKAADPDPWRVALRDQIGRDDREILRRLAADPKTLETQPRRSLVLLALALIDQGELHRAKQVLQRAWRLDPGDFWVNYVLGAVEFTGERIARPEEATRYLSAAVAIRPRSFAAHYNLARTLDYQCKQEEAIAEFREALRLQPENAHAHNNLGVALHDQGKQEEATAQYRTALRLEPDLVEARNNLGIVLHDQGKREEAITEYLGALRLKPDFPEAHCNLGHELRKQGQFAAALAELKQGHKLGSKRPRWPYPSAQWVQQAERLVKLDGKLPAILSGKVKPADATEAVGFAQLCDGKKLHGASARFWSEAFQAQPRLAEDMRSQHRYNAACAAALAGSGKGEDDPPLDEATRACWRKQAIDWLEADLAAWSKILESGPIEGRLHQPDAPPHEIGQAAWSKVLESGPIEGRPFVEETLQRWKADSDLAGLRDPAALAKLPGDEPKACRALWTGVDALLVKARGGRTPWP